MPQGETMEVDPLANDRKWWRYKLRCRNCQGTVVYSVNVFGDWANFYRLHSSRLTDWLVCEQCGAFAVHDMVAMTGQPEGND